MATQFAFGKIVTDGLVLALDTVDKNSYPGSGTTWKDLAGTNNGTLVNGVGFDVDSLNFDGVDDYTQTPLAGTFPQITFDYWGFYDDSALNTRLRNESAFGDWTSNRIHWGTRWSVGMHWNVNNAWVEVPTTNLKYGWNHFSLIWNNSTSQKLIYINNILSSSEGTNGNVILGDFRIGVATVLNAYYRGKIANFKVYNRALTVSEVQENYNAIKSRNLPGSIFNPFLSPVQAQSGGYAAGSYYFKYGAMSSPLLLEYQPNYYENKPFCCVFRSPYRSTATTNRINLSIPMGGLLVQRDTLDLRGAVYWSVPITYNSVGGTGNNTADSGTGYAGSNARRVMLGFGGGHGIYNSNQQQCNWGDSTGGIGAGWDGVNCGTFPNDLVWGTGNISAVYENRSGTWSHWITWN